MTYKKRSTRANVRRASLLLAGVILMLVGVILWALVAIGVFKQAGNPLLNPLFVAGDVIVGIGMLFGAVDVLRSVPAAVLRKYILLDVGLILMGVGTILLLLVGMGVLRQAEHLLIFDPFFNAGITIICIGILLGVVGELRILLQMRR